MQRNMRQHRLDLEGQGQTSISPIESAKMFKMVDARIVLSIGAFTSVIELAF